MIPEQRRAVIRDLLARDAVVPLRDLVDRLGVSLMTVRRDVAALEAEGVAVAVSGGVRAAAAGRPPIDRSGREALEPARKLAIAVAAARSVGDGGSLFLDAGTTCLAIARALPAGPELRIVTTDLRTALVVADRPRTEVVVAGGTFDAASGSTDGGWAAQTVSAVAMDLCFLSTGAWSLRDGVTTTSLDKVAIKRAAVQAARRSVLVADATKFGASDPFRVIGVQDLDAVVTDDGLDGAARRRIRDLGVELTTASPLRPPRPAS